MCSQIANMPMVDTLGDTIRLVRFLKEVAVARSNSRKLVLQPRLYFLEKLFERAFHYPAKKDSLRGKTFLQRLIIGLSQPT